jgi:ribosomal protein S14
MPSSSKPSDGRRVFFHPRVRSRRALPLKDYKVKEIRRCWYTLEETEIMRKDVNLSRQTFEGAPECERGMEYRALCGRISRTWIKTAAVNAVLEEQHSQWATGDLDPHAIAKAYRRITEQCENAARIQGREDHLESILENIDVPGSFMTKVVCGDVRPALIDLPRQEYLTGSWGRNEMSTAAA